MSVERFCSINYSFSDFMLCIFFSLFSFCLRSDLWKSFCSGFTHTRPPCFVVVLRWDFHISHSMHCAKEKPHPNLFQEAICCLTPIWHIPGIDTPIWWCVCSRVFVEWRVCYNTCKYGFCTVITATENMYEYVLGAQRRDTHDGIHCEEKSILLWADILFKYFPSRYIGHLCLCTCILSVVGHLRYIVHH